MTSRRSRWPNPRQRPERPESQIPQRSPYTPQVRQRGPDNVLRTWITAAVDTLRASLLIPSAGRSLRLVRIWAMIDPAEATSTLLELYFGTGTNANTTRSKIIDILRTGTSAGVIQTRTYDALSVGRAPTGIKDESISYRWTAAPTNAHRIFIEYVEIDNPKRKEP